MIAWRSEITARRRRSRGLSAIELLVVVVIGALFLLTMVMALPRRRESARLASCQHNLMQIGLALALYDQSQRHLPTALPPGIEAGDRATSPLKALLVELGVPDLTTLNDAKNPPPKQPGLTHPERRIPGFVCPSDPHAAAALFAAPLSYRACTGDASDGRNGSFAPGRQIGIASVEAADGASYTAGFAERLVGDNQPEHPTPINYALAPGPLVGHVCPATSRAAWLGDAGSSWVASNWQSTLYNHALTPNAQPSCIAADRRTALMGASSGHTSGVNLLFLDGGVRTFTPAIDPKIWREWANVPADPSPGGEGQPGEGTVKSQ
jgi:prepilin-type processing-associated H-X9-DG protein